MGDPTSALGSPSGDELHELRVRIPMDLHRQLLSLKILRGKSLADTVSLALDIYFTKSKTSPPAHTAEEQAADAGSLT
ncbi:MAG: hypothetical protein WDA16_01100 [Candidatus Thermoplasmatota archaeon]